ncbi:MAG: putative lipid II flippase FtsW [Patescibacteria group bacterium]
MSALQKNSPNTKVVTFLFFALIIFGLVMLASAGVAEGQKRCGSAYCFLWHQIEFGVLPGIIIFWLFSKIKYDRWRRFALPILLLSIVSLILIFVPGMSTPVKGAQRWLDIKIATVQPAEFLKFALIVYLAAWFGRREKSGHGVFAHIPFFLVLGCVAALLVLQPDFGTLGIVILIGMAMFFFSGAKFKHIAALIIVSLVILGGLALAAPYRFDRIKTFLDPHSDKQGTSYHINQAKISIGSGGMFGLGYGQSRQKLNYLPEPLGDSIFAITVEELGFVGGVALIALYVAFLFAMIRLAKHTTDPFGRLFVLGVATWIGGQAFINIAAISGLVPLTGVPLPLISYGSSSLVSLMAAMGVVRSVARS